MELTCINETVFSVDEQNIEKLCEWITEQSTVELPAEISIVFVSEQRMAELNQRYYGHRGATDVLTFPYDNDVAEIILNPAQIQNQAPQFTNSFSEELAENIIHSFLHLSGYDHTKEKGKSKHLSRQKELMTALKEKDSHLTLIE